MPFFIVVIDWGISGKWGGDLCSGLAKVCMAQGLNALCYVADDIVWGLPCFNKSSFLSQSSGTDSVAADDLQGRPTLNLSWLSLSSCRLCIIFTTFRTERTLGDGDVFLNKVLLDDVTYFIDEWHCPIFPREESQKQLSFSCCFFLAFFLLAEMEAEVCSNF